MLNGSVGNEESILVSEIKSMAPLLCNISKSESNLFRRELMLTSAIINLLGFFDLLFSIFEQGSRFNSCVNVDKVL